MVNRNEFLKGVVATAAVAGLGSAQAGDKTATLPVPEGREFAGMAGAYAALYTPFDKAGRLNEEMVEQLVERGIRKGLAGFYLTGSTGEGFLLSDDERKRVYARAAKAAKGRAKLIAHVGCLATENAVALAKSAADAGCDWVSSVAPVYFGQSFEAAFHHYQAVSEATDLPFLIYSVGKTIDPARDAKLFSLKNVKGMKYTGYAYWSVQALKRRLDRPAIFFAGADEQVLSALAAKDVFSGCIGTTDNVIPGHFAKICELAAQGDFRSAAVLQDEVVQLVELIFESDNGSWHKAKMRYIGFDCGAARAPEGWPLTDAEYAALCAKLDKLGFVTKG